jgi:hypothetical protein
MIDLEWMLLHYLIQAKKNPPEGGLVDTVVG